MRPEKGKKGVAVLIDGNPFFNLMFTEHWALFSSRLPVTVRVGIVAKRMFGRRKKEGNESASPRWKWIAYGYQECDDGEKIRTA